MRRFTIIFALILGLSAVAVPCSHAAFDKDLGQGLRYFRTANMAADLGSLRQATRAPAVILDLRGASATAEALHEFDLTLGQATTAGLRIILLNAKTAPDVVRLVTTPRRRQITISPASANLPTDLKVNIATDQDGSTKVTGVLVELAERRIGIQVELRAVILRRENEVGEVAVELVFVRVRSDLLERTECAFGQRVFAEDEFGARGDLKNLVF